MIIMEFYQQSDHHPEVYDFLLTREGYLKGFLPTPKPIGRVKQFVLEGDRPTERQRAYIRTMFEMHPDWTCFDFLKP